MAYTPQDINRFIQAHDNVETRVLCAYWNRGDHIDDFRKDSKRLKTLFVRLHYPLVEEYAIPETNSEAELEKEIWKHLQTFQNGQSVLIIYYGGHGEKGGKGRWVAYDKMGQGPAIEWQSIQGRLSRFHDRILVIIDSCFAGSAMRGAEDYNLSLCNMVGLQRGSKKTPDSVVPGNVELWLATSFHGQTPVKEPTFTQAIVHTLDGQLRDAGMSISVLRAHKKLIELESGNRLRCQPIYQPLENSYQKSIEIHHFDITKRLAIVQDPSTMIEVRLQLNTLDEDTMPMLVQWLAAHPSNVISQECQNIETCIRATHEYVSQDVQRSSYRTSLTPFQYLSASLKQRTFDAYQKLTQSALALLSVHNSQPSEAYPFSTNKLKARTASQQLEEAWTRFKAQMQQNILLGPDNSEEDAVLRMMEDPETKKMGLSQILHMRLLAM